MSPRTRRRIVALLLLLIPMLSWITITRWHTGRSLATGYTSDFWLLLFSTPSLRILQGSLLLGLLTAWLASWALVRPRRTGGFKGQAYAQRLRGSRCVTSQHLQRLCREPGNQQIELAGFEMPTALETLHLLVAGATGSGKSVLLRALVASLCQRGDRLFVVDPNGELMRHFWQTGDVILNPYDKRTQGWSLFNEIRTDYDWKRLALAMVPISADRHAEEWNDFGRLLLRETARKLYQTDPQRATVAELFRLCTIEDPETLRQFLAGTLAESLFAGSNQVSKALLSARFVLSNKLSEHTTMPIGAFSIRDWLQTPGTGNLYINWREDMVSALRPLVSAWTDVFITTLLSLPEDPSRRCWLLMDELASLDTLPSLAAGLTKGRKHGLRIVAGLQSTAQLEHVYGRSMAQSLRASFRNLVVLGGSRTDPQTAEELSQSLGEHEIIRPEYSVSQSVDARSTSSRPVRSLERIVTAAEIQSLPALTGYLALATDYPIAPFHLQLKTLPMRTRPFEERVDLRCNDACPQNPWITLCRTQ